jgi:hypothetical protein
MVSIVKAWESGCAYPVCKQFIDCFKGAPEPSHLLLGLAGVCFAIHDCGVQKNEVKNG